MMEADLLRAAAQLACQRQADRKQQARSRQAAGKKRPHGRLAEFWQSGVFAI